MEKYISESAKKALSILEDNGYEAYLVGGGVRDMLLGCKPHDFDITTNAFPNEMQQIFKGFHVVETGIKHGTLTVVIDKEPIEITTYRSDGEYTDFRHPDTVNFTRNLEEDLKRRDFTVNAFCLSKSGEVVDMFNGKADLKNKIIRAVGDAKKRFTEDALRILRGVRFASVLGFEIEEKTWEAMKDCAHLLKNISKERIAIEINKFLCGKNVKDALLKYSEIIGEIIPEINIMKGFSQENPHHIYDILTHTAVTVENTEPITELRLSALLHDTGKIYTFKKDENGVGHFYSHPQKSTEVAKRYLDEYKYDNYTKERVELLVKIHDSVIEEDKIFIKKRLARIGTDAFFQLLKLQRADNSAQSPKYNRKSHFDTVERIANEILRENECFSLKNLNVNGKDLIEAGFEKGEKIGQILSFLLDSVVEEKAENKKNILINMAKEKFGG